MKVYKEYNICAGEFHSESLVNDRLFYHVLIASYPAWFEPVIDEYSGYLNGWSFTAPMLIGEFEVTFRKQKTGQETYVDYVIKINIGVTCGLTIYENCCVNQCNIAWLNREGGFSNYIFTGVKEFRVEIGGNEKYVTSGLVQKYSQIDGVYNGKICTTGDIPRSHVDYLDSLQYAIQAFLYNEETELWDIPILIDKKDFVKYKTDDRMFDIKIKFIYAEELLIQTQ